MSNDDPTSGVGRRITLGYRCDRSPLVEAYARLLVEPPVSIAWPLFTQTLRIVRNDYQPFGEIELSSYTEVSAKP